MLSRTIFFSVLVFLLILVGNISAQTKSPSLPTKSSSKLHSDPNIAKIIEQFKRISAKKSKDELRMIASVGLISGGLEAMKNMEEHLTLMVSDLILNSDMSDTQKIMPKLDRIENTLERDLRAVQILANALDLARGNITKVQYRNRVKEIAQEYQKYAKDIKLKTANTNPRERLENLKVKILEHMDMMHRELGSKTNETIKHLETMQKLQQQKRKRNRSTQRQKKQRQIPRNVTAIKGARSKSRPRVAPFQTNVTRNNDRILKEILLDSTDKNVIQRKQDIGNEFRTNGPRNKNKDTKLAPLKDDDEDYDEEYSDEDYDDDNGGGEGGGGGFLSGGLAGLITSLSGGGEEGSDFGAIFGALTGVVSRLFGPGGLDIPSLIGSGTALLSGLLAGDKNFGTVLGEYIGVTLDGVSGGGGAINNGKFLGYFLGTTLAKLSADPEDEDLPPKPLLFLKNFMESFLQAKKGGGELEDDEENGDAENVDQGHHHHGSNSFGFIAHVVKAVVGGVTSFVLNSSLGLSGGSSQGSASLSGSSHDKGHSAGIEHPKFH